MRPLTALTLALILTACPSTPAPTPQALEGEAVQASAPSKWVMGYYMGYLENVMPPSAVDWRGLTHLAVGFFLPRADGSLDLSIASSAGTRSSLLAAGKRAGRKVLATVGGQDSGPQWRVATSGAARAAFLENLKNLVRRDGYSGLDLDWEPLETADQPLLLALVRDLRKALPGATLTFPSDGLSNLNFPADRRFYAQLAPFLDQLNLMTYGMAGTYEGWKTWHSSALYGATSSAPTSVDLSVQEYLNAGVPASKLGIGIGLYGLCYGPPAKGPLEDTVGTRPDGARILAGDNEMSYANIVTQYAPLGKRVWDANARAPYLRFAAPGGPKGCTYLSYEDWQSILEKGQYVRAKGLGGAILWNVNQGYVGGKNPLLEATRRAFLGG